MDNISYTIIDTCIDSSTGTIYTPTDFDINLYRLDEEMDTLKYEETDTLKYDELYTLYMSYSVKSLLQIMNYYNIQKKRLLKEEIILFLINFELDFTNHEIVLKRIRLWENITELSQDNYFKSYITFTV